MKIQKSRLSLILYLFALLFDPPIFPKVTFTNILLIYSLLYILYTYGKDTKEVIINSKIHRIGALFLISSIFFIICVSYNVIISKESLLPDYIYAIMRFTRDFAALFICTIYVLLRCKKGGFIINDLLIMLLYAGAIEACLTVISFISPSVRGQFISIMAQNIKVENIANSITTVADFRAYGFAANLFDAFGYSTSILVTIALSYAYFKKFSYIFLTLFLFTMPLLNARTGIIMTALAVMLLILTQLFSKGNFKSSIKFISILFILVILISVYSNSIFKIAPATFEFIQNGIEETLTIFNSNEKTGIYSALLTELFLFFPSGLSFWVGTGLEPIILIGRSSDVGYVANIWKFGIIGSAFLYSILIRLFYYSYTACRSSQNRYIILFLSISFFLYLIKSNALGINPGTITIFMICFKIIYDNSIMNLPVEEGKFNQEYKKWEQ